jgi:NADH dehydrogenase
MIHLADELGPVLVTGANGQLGRRLIRRLASGREPSGSVRAVVRSERAAAALRELPGTRPEIAILDYRDVEQLTRAARGCRFAVHLTGIIKETRANRYRDAHEATSEAMARAGAAAGLERIVYLSVLGSDPASPNACLASKGRAEQILIRGETPVVILRVPMVLGPGDASARVVEAEARARLLPLVGGGRARTQPIYADDVVEAILRGILRPDLAAASIDLAGPESLSQREFVARAAALYGSRPLVLPIPTFLANAAALLAERLLADPPLTRDMLGVINRDDEVDVGTACRQLALELTPLDEALRLSLGPEAAEA